jgi:hypothetical protein
MTDAKTVDRRMLLRGAGVAGATLAGVTATAGAASAHGGDHGQSGVVGSWLITHVDDPPSSETGHAVVSLAPGGVLTEVEINPVAAPGAGAWSGYGDRFKATFWTGDPGDPKHKQPAVVVKVDVRGKVRGDKVAGTYSVTIYDTKGKQVDTGSGKFYGDRVTAD